MQHTFPSTALITGASRGLGRALAEALAARGAELVLLARQASALDAVVHGLRARGGRAHAIPADVATLDASAVAARVAELVGPLDLLVHNASTLGPVPMPELGELREDDLREVFEVNVLGPQRLTHALLGPMRRAGRGLVLTISSDAAVHAYPGWGAYGASKAALDHLSAVLAAELAGTGVRALAVDPGEMDTQMHRDALPDADPATLATPAAVARAMVGLLERLPEAPRVAVEAAR
ncbi:MAG: SDR family NAD(P)-dependent oxidoreductase [Myxococcota bacterium]